uniref:FXYD domain-containing ion transport regulator n=2 Tax=Strongyloides papillosus TaxID=174720 RepID=A0A0N5CIE7_STREA
MSLMTTVCLMNLIFTGLSLILVNEAISRNDNEIESKETAIPTDYTPFLAMGGIFIVVIGVLLVVVSKNRSSLKKGAVANESSSTSRTRTR